MDATILGYDDSGYWIKGGTLAEHLQREDVSDSQCDIGKIHWLQRWPGIVTYLNGEPV